MIQKFNQFINESNGAQNPLSHSDKINDAYSALALFLSRCLQSLFSFGYAPLYSL